MGSDKSFKTTFKSNLQEILFPPPSPQPLENTFIQCKGCGAVLFLKNLKCEYCGNGGKYVL